MVRLSALVDSAARAGSRLIDLLLPPTCMACRTPVATPLGLCADCWSALAVIEGARCRRCGVPLPAAYQTELACLGCLHQPPAFDTAAAAWLYEGTARTLVLQLKAGREAIAAPMARTMQQAGQAVLHPDHLVVPVPLHRWRLARRGFNQALLLARGVAKSNGRPVLPFALERVKATPISRGMSRAQRQRNVQGAFRVPEQFHAVVRGAAILLVDDVMTSGATASACARALKRAGAGRVDVLTCARVVVADANAYSADQMSDADAQN